MNIEKEIGYILTEKKWTLSTAESCSGGHIADKITNVSGSSKYFFGGLITYSIETKIKLLGIEKEYFDLYSVYSSKVAEKMAENVRKKIGTTFGIAVTGIAPPGDEDSKKAVGTVFVGISSPQKVETFNLKLLSKTREQFKENLAQEVLKFFYEMLLKITEYNK